MQIKTKEDRRDRIKYRIRKKMAGTPVARVTAGWPSACQAS